MDDIFVFPGDGDGDGLRCQKHPPAQPAAGGVCPICLRDRLLRLCPHCGCPSTSCTTTASSSSSISSVPSADLRRCGTTGSHTGAVRSGSNLIDSNPTFHRSRSAAFRSLRPRSEDASGARDRGGIPQPASGRWSWLWPFRRGRKREHDEGKNNASNANLLKSRSVSVLPGEHMDAGVVYSCASSGRPKGWNRYLPDSMKALRQQKESKTEQAKSALAEEKVRMSDEK